MKELYTYYCANLINSNSNVLIFRVRDSEIMIKSNRELI